MQPGHVSSDTQVKHGSTVAQTEVAQSGFCVLGMFGIRHCSLKRLAFGRGILGLVYLQGTGAWDIGFNLSAGYRMGFTATSGWNCGFHAHSADLFRTIGARCKGAHRQALPLYT